MKKRYWIGGISATALAAVAAKLLLRPSDVEWEKNREAVFHADYSRFIEVDGVQVHYQEAGDSDGPPMILIHGFAASNLVWSKVFLELAEAGFRVIAPDLLGYGYSGKPRNLDYTIARQAEMVVSFMQGLGIDRAVLVGSSYGAAIAVTIALDRPALVEKLVLVGAVTNNKPTRFLLMRLFGSPIIGDVLSPLVVGSRRLLRLRMKRVYDRHAWELDERRVDARHLPLRTRGAHRAIIRTVRRWDAERVSRDAHLLTQPTLLLWGDKDREVPLRDGEHLHDEIPDSRLVVFRECGHLPHEEYPETFTKLVVAFVLARSDSTS
ncbi:MAG TPA: alpha/beta hydrolase [Pyrinomonadaceae bacterium]|jgi:pimeloyl-ACP methyl ester carboxylesterase|nr:alpha/beta hydrolase [Pyrinomonadaceae bacterium]